MLVCYTNQLVGILTNQYTGLLQVSIDVYQLDNHQLGVRLLRNFLLMIINWWMTGDQLVINWWGYHDTIKFKVHSLS